MLFNSNAKVRRTKILITPRKHSVTRGMTTTPNVEYSVGVLLLAVVLLRSTWEKRLFFNPALCTGLYTLNAFGVLPNHKTYDLIMQ